MSTALKNGAVKYMQNYLMQVNILDSENHKGAKKLPQRKIAIT